MTDRNQCSVCCGCIALLLFYYCAALLSTSLYCCVQGMKEAEKPKEVAKPVVAAKPADDKPVAKKIDLTDE